MKRIVLWLAGLALLLSGCALTQKTPAESQIFAMDTVMSFRIYGEAETAQTALEQAAGIVNQLEQRLSVTNPNSEISLANRTQGSWRQLSPDTTDLLQQALALCEETEGNLDITAYPAVKAWGFTTGDYRVPEQEELQKLAKRIDWTQVKAEEGRVYLPVGTELDLGAVAKGYAGDCLAKLMEQMGVDCAMFSLGGNIQAVGSRPDGAPWRIGIQDPAGDEGSYLAALEVENKAVVTSGGYQRYFMQDGQTWWHIMDPETAAPAQTDLLSVTVVGASGTICDGLSTALFVMGSEDAAQFWREHPEAGSEMVFVRADGTIVLTQGLEDTFSLAAGQENREVMVITR